MMRPCRLSLAISLATCWLVLAAIGGSVAGAAEVLFLEGHREPVYAVRYSPDGKFLVSGGFDKQVRIWDLASRQTIRVLADHTDTVLAIAISRDGKHLATAGLDKTILIYDLPTAASPPAEGAPQLAPRLKLAGHTAQIYGVDFAADGTRLASAGAEGVVKLWNVADGANTANCAGHTGPVYGVAAHPAEPRFASCGADGSIRQWQAGDGSLIREFKEGIRDGLYSVEWSPDGSRLLAAGLAKTWYLWNGDQQPPALAIAGHRDFIYRASFHPTGTRLATIGYTGQLAAWDAASGTQLHAEKLPVRSGYSVAWSPDGAQWALATSDPRVMLVDVPPAAR